jgi:redox-sensitive bicupin YhaK (pirin superfamily)
MKVYRKEDHGRADHGWLKSRFHFAFADYFNRSRMGYGVLRVLNDDRVSPGKGFDTHPHRDMEIISYVVEGELTHKDSMGTEETLYPGEIQYMSAGTGILHSEYNRGSGDLRFLQIWILPDRKDHPPRYGSKRIPMEARRDRWLHLVSSEGEGGEIPIHQDARIYGGLISKGETLDYTVEMGRQIYGIIIEGRTEAGRFLLGAGDGFESTESLSFRAEAETHILLIEMRED